MADPMFVRLEFNLYVPIVRKKNTKVFIVHGHDSVTKEIIVRFLEDLGLIPVVLHEIPNEGRTLIGKLEKNADVPFAIVLLTPDDVAYPKGQEHSMKTRARQNVIFELGFFIGKLGRHRVCALYKEDVEIPSDLHGFIHISMDNTDDWKRVLAREIKHIGLKVNLERAFLGNRRAV